VSRPPSRRCAPAQRGLGPSRRAPNNDNKITICARNAHGRLFPHFRSHRQARLRDRRLASFGAQVICGDLAIAQAKATAQEITAGGSPAEALHIDLCDGKSVAAAAATVGTPDVLVISPSINVRKPVLDYTEDEFDRVVGLNLKGIFRALKAFVPGMVKRGKGSVIVFSSIRAQVVEPGQGVYAATKAGTVQMIRALAAEIGPSGVRANAIAPGIVETPLTQQIKQNDAWYRAYADKSVMHRWAQPSELVGAVVYLASDASSYVTGSYFLVDGGWTAADGRFTPPLPASSAMPVA
jgi:NAD(P)-dependent dehydrogenase (short-subunit alcohol dehydrogenase family)